MKFLNRSSNQPDNVETPNTTIGVGSSFRGTLMVSGTLRIEGEVEGDVWAISVMMEPGVYFTGRCTMLESGTESVQLGQDYARSR